MEGLGKKNVHNAAGVAPGFAAVSDQECSVSLFPEENLGLDPVEVPQLPGPLVVVRQVLVVLDHRILTGGGGRRRKTSQTKG